MEAVRVIGLSFRHRDGEVERGPPSKFTLKPDAPTLHLNKTLGDIQTETCARHFPSLGVIGPKKFLKDFDLVFNADANPVILHPQVHDLFRTFRVPLVGTYFATNEDF